MANHSKARTEAEAKFKKTQKAQRAAEGSQAMSEYVAAGHAVRAKTARLKEQRLAKEAADKKAAGRAEVACKEWERWTQSTA